MKANMNATLSHGGKVHRIIDGFARCGVARNAKTRAWQTEFCAVTCGRCVKLAGIDGRKEAQKSQEGSTTDAH